LKTWDKAADLMMLEMEMYEQFPERLKGKLDAAIRRQDRARREWKREVSE
jgi:hypothetical protein